MPLTRDAHVKETLDTIDEFEREPVPADKVKGFKSFLGMVAGEHIAGTEFVIGPLFVLHGAGARDVFYLFRRLGLTPNLASVTGSRFNAAVALAWAGAIAAGYGLFRYTEADFFFFMALPGWFVGAVLYVLVSVILQRRRPAPALREEEA